MDAIPTDVALWVPPLVAFVISFFTSMGGVSGAFLLLPFQVSVLGFTAPAVSATNQLYNATSIPAGVYRYWREGRMLWPLTWVIVAGTLPGVVIGALIRVRWLPDPDGFKLFAAAVMAVIGGRMVRDLVRAGGRATVGEAAFRAGAVRQGPDGAAGSPPGGGGVRVTARTPTRLEFTFSGERYELPVLSLTGLAFGVGLVGGTYGIGGGAIIAPLLLSFYGLPVYTIAGPVLMATFVTSVVGVATYQLLAPFYPGLNVAPDWMLGFLFGAGGMAGMYLGARAQKRVPAAAIKWLLAAVLLATAGKYLLDAWPN